MKNYMLALSLMSFAPLFGQIENGMIAHFPFNNDLSDVTANGSAAVNAGSTFTADRNGIPNYAVDFNGSGHVVVSSNNMKVNFPITVSLWVNLNSISAVNTFFKTDNVFNNYYGVWINNLPTGGITLSFGSGLGTTNSSNQRYFTTSDNFISAGTWHHIVGIIRSYNDMEIYVDCVKANGTFGGTGLTNVVYSSDGEAWLGGSIGTTAQPSGANVDGKMDQFAFWNRALTSQEIQFLCDTNNPLSVSEIEQNELTVIGVFDILGRETSPVPNIPLIFEYSDGSRKKVVITD